MALPARVQKALEVVRQRYAELVDILKKIEDEGASADLTEQRLERWRRRAIDSLSEYISPDEGQRFERNLFGIAYRNPWDGIHKDIKDFIIKLQVLEEELHERPDSVLSRSNIGDREPKGSGTEEPVAASRPSSEAAIPVQQRKGGESVEPRAVFVVHGRNEAARAAMFTFLRAIDLKPMEWAEAVKATGKASPYIGEVLEAAFSRAQAVVVLLTPDDEARLREGYREVHDPPHERELTPQARPNVLFEAGMALGRHPDRTVLVELGTLRPFSDVAGRHLVRIDNSVGKRQAVATRLRDAGCAVNVDGTDWHTAGNFPDLS